MFELLAAKIHNLYYQQAIHRKGFRINDATPQLAASNTVEELGELLTAMVLNDRLAVQEELGDVLAVVLHLVLMLQRPEEHELAQPEDLDLLEQVAIAKLELRFTV